MRLSDNYWILQGKSKNDRKVYILVHPNYNMSYEEIKIIGGKKYKYLRTSYRVGDVVKHKSKYIGPVKPINETKK